MEQNHFSRICPNCGQPALDEDIFCMICGAKLPEINIQKPPPGQAVCPVCGGPIEPEDLFCMSCGAKLVTEKPEEIFVQPVLPEDIDLEFAENCEPEVLPEILEPQAQPVSEDDSEPGVRKESTDETDANGLIEIPTADEAEPPQVEDASVVETQPEGDALTDTPQVPADEPEFQAEDEDELPQPEEPLPEPAPAERKRPDKKKLAAFFLSGIILTGVLAVSGYFLLNRGTGSKDNDALAQTSLEPVENSQVVEPEHSDVPAISESVEPAAPEPSPGPSPADTDEPPATVPPSAAPTPLSTPVPAAALTAAPAPTPTPAQTPEPTPKPTPNQTPEPTPRPTPEPTSKPEPIIPIGVEISYDSIAKYWMDVEKNGGSGPKVSPRLPVNCWLGERGGIKFTNLTFIKASSETVTFKIHFSATQDFDLKIYLQQGQSNEVILATDSITASQTSYSFTTNKNALKGGILWFNFFNSNFGKHEFETFGVANQNLIFIPAWLSGTIFDYL